MATKLWAICLVLLCTLLTSSAQVLYKFGVQKLVFNFANIIANYYLIIGVLLYMAGAVLLVIALKHGELSILYPIIAMSYVFVSFLSRHFFNELITPLKLTGIILIIAGVSAIGFGIKNGH